MWRWLRWRTDRELHEEIEAHLEIETRENIERGVPVEDARYRALRAFGNPARVRQLAREASPLYQVDVLMQDVRFAMRLLRRTPLLAATIVLTLVFGIGLNASVFTILNAFLLRPLVSKDPATFVQLYANVSGQQSRVIFGSPAMLTLDEYEAIGAQARTLSAVTASAPVALTLGGDEPINVRGQLVSCNYLAAHLDAPLLGRTFQPADCASAGGQPVAVLNETFWRNRFQADPSVVGRTVLLNRHPLTVIGVAPNQLTLDVPPVSIWVPFTMQPVFRPAEDHFRPGSKSADAWLDVSGRLAPGATHRHVQTELSMIAARLDRLHPGRQMRIPVTNGAHMSHPDFATKAPVVVGLIMGSFMLILLIVCANVTLLMLSRAAARRQETAIRLSLGAGRGRLLRQLLTESLLLAAIAGALSWWVAQYLPRAMFALSADMPSEVSFNPDWRVFVFTFAAATIAGCAAGFSPALESLRVNLTASLRPTGGGGGGSRQVRVRRWLVTGQLAASIGLLVAAGLIVRVQTHLFQTDLGYDPRTIVVTPLALSRIGYTESVARTFHDRLLERIRSLPGIRGVGLANGAPFRSNWSTLVNVPEDNRTQSRQRVSLRRVSPAYFEAMRIPLLQGRLFTDADTRSPGRATPIIVSSTFARRFWPNRDPLGQRLQGSDNTESQVVGVAGDISSVRPGELDGPLYYEPLGRQSVLDTVLIVRSTGDGASMVPAIRTAIRELNPDLPIEPETLRAELDRQAERYAFLLKVAWVPSALALMLCVLGVYGVAAFAAAQRTQEIGIRLAIGATPRDVHRMLVVGVRWPLLVGIVAGVAFGAAIGILMDATGLLIEVHPIDPITYAGACAIVGAAAVLATFLPALRASHLDPWLALRDE